MSNDGKLMSGKRGLIMGVANDHSIAWGIAEMLAEHGAELAFTYQGEGFGRRVWPLADQARTRAPVGASPNLPSVPRPRRRSPESTSGVSKFQPARDRRSGFLIWRTTIS